MYYLRTLLTITAIVLGSTSILNAATSDVKIPDAGSIMREIGDNPKILPDKAPENLLTIPPPPTPSTDKGPTVPVKSFKIIGATLFQETELQTVMAAYLNQELNFSQLDQAIQKIASYYTTRGFMAQVMLPQQDVIDGIITVQILEGKLGAIEVSLEQNVRYSEERIKNFITYQQPVGEPLRLDSVEDALMLINDNPGIVAAANLKTGVTAGTTDLLVKVGSTPLVTGGLTFDNSGSISTGEYRLTADLNVNNSFGIGDQIAIKGLSSIDNNYGRLAYTFPLGGTGLRLSSNVSYLHYTLTGDLKTLKANGTSLNAGSSLSIPIVHRRTGNFYGTAGYEYRASENNANNQETSNKVTHVGTIGFSGDKSDGLFGGGYTSLSLTATIGGIDLSANASDSATDQAGPRVQGVYTKFSCNFSRSQKLYEDVTSFQLNVNGQYALKNLDSSEKISIGGPSAIRALPPNEGSGDHGVVVNAEIQQNITNSIKVFGFYDFGWVQQHQTLYNGWYSSKGAPNSFHADGVGMGVIWGSQGFFNIKATVAERLEKNPATTAQGKDSDGTLRQPRYWVQASLFF